MNEQWLFQFCKNNKDQEVVFILDNNPNIDLSKNDGIYFQHAIKNKNPAMLDALLKYYRKTLLAGDNNSREYHEALEKLNIILEEAKAMQAGRIFPPEIAKVIKEYFNFGAKEEDEDEQDLSGFEDLEEDTFHGSNESLVSSESNRGSHEEEIPQAPPTDLLGEELPSTHS